jgi:nitroreductase
VTVDEVIRGRRTLKAFRPEPVPAAVVDELLDLAVYAPNHHTTEPWRFAVIGTVTIARLVEATGDAKLTRSQTAIVVTQAVDPDPEVATEDYAACACAIQTLMLAARARDYASYWRTPKSLLHPVARELLGLAAEERLVGIVHLGRPLDPFPAPPRRAAGTRTRRLA